MLCQQMVVPPLDSGGVLSGVWTATTSTVINKVPDSKGHSEFSGPSSREGMLQCLNCSVAAVYLHFVLRRLRNFLV